MKRPSLWKRLALYSRELRNYLSLLSAGQAKRAVVFYSEKDIYYQYFEGLIEYLLQQSTLPICYLTSDPDDPLLRNKNPRIKVFYFKNLVASLFARLNARVVILTMPDLQQFHIKRSFFPVHYVYLFHAVVSTHLQYNHGAFDYYDAIFCVGPHHVEELRRAEELYHLKRKILIESGYHRIEKIYRDHQVYLSKQDKQDVSRKQILIAPTWGKSSILEICIDPLVDVLATTDYDVTIRPHPEFTKRRPELAKSIRERVEKKTNMHWKTDLLMDEDIHHADVLITDRSGIVFEYAFGTERPVLFIDTPLKIHNPRYEELGVEPIEISTRRALGISISVEEIPGIASIVSDVLANQSSFRKQIIAYRGESLFNWMRSAEVEGQYIVSLLSPPQKLL